jgi:pSer/pThr/pTyr-binding forkhead associated (FHA) protein
MINCRVCKNKEYQGSLFCSECGSQLMFLTGLKVDTLVYPAQIRGLELDIRNTIPKNLLETRNFILYYQDGHEVLNLPDQDEFTIGRFVQGQVITPDVDLTRYDAFDNGISRLHATIRIDEENNKVYVIDLASANGSSVNGFDIPPNSEVPLNHGDILTLGKISFQVILSKEVK